MNPEVIAEFHFDPPLQAVSGMDDHPLVTSAEVLVEHPSYLVVRFSNGRVVLVPTTGDMETSIKNFLGV